MELSWHDLCREARLQDYSIGYETCQGGKGRKRRKAGGGGFSSCSGSSLLVSGIGDIITARYVFRGENQRGCGAILLRFLFWETTTH
jgi:hypothetical protein